jgi:hypothetical protein
MVARERRARVGKGCGCVLVWREEGGGVRYKDRAGARIGNICTRDASHKEKQERAAEWREFRAATKPP